MAGKKKSVVSGYLTHVFIDGFSGMATGLFATLIVGTIMSQIGALVGGTAGAWIGAMANVAKILTGAGIGVGVAVKYQRANLVVLSCAVAGTVGAYAAQIRSGDALFTGPGEPLGAFIAAFIAAEIGGIIAGKTKLDILITPIVTISLGSAAGLFVGPTISAFMGSIGDMINWGTERQPLIMGIVVAVLMGLALTLPISSAALGIILKLSGIAAGAACAGCCAQMIGFAVASYRENKMGGLLAQGLGTSMLQIPNIMKRPLIWLPATIASAICGPVSSFVLKMTCNATGSGMGTAGLIGPVMTWQTMTGAGVSPVNALWQIALVQFILPAVIALWVSEIMRKCGAIRPGDMRLDI